MDIISLEADCSAPYEYMVNRDVRWNDDSQNQYWKHDRQLRSIGSSNFGLDAEDHGELNILWDLSCRLNAPDIHYR